MVPKQEAGTGLEDAFHCVLLCIIQFLSEIGCLLTEKHNIYILKIKNRGCQQWG